MRVASNFVENGKLVSHRAPIAIVLGEQGKTNSGKRTVVRYNTWALAAAEPGMLEPLREAFGGEITRTETDWRLPIPPTQTLTLALKADSCAILNRRVDPSTGTLVGDCDGGTLHIAGRLGASKPCMCKQSGQMQCQVSVDIEGRLYADGLDIHPLIRAQKKSQNLADELVGVAELFQQASADEVVLANVGYLNNQGKGRMRWDEAKQQVASAGYARLRINGTVLVTKAQLAQAAVTQSVNRLFVDGVADEMPRGGEGVAPTSTAPAITHLQAVVEDESATEVPEAFYDEEVLEEDVNTITFPGF